MTAPETDRWLRLCRHGLVLLLSCAVLTLAGCSSDEEDEYASEGSSGTPVAIGTAPGAIHQGTVGKAPASSYYSVTIPASSTLRTFTMSNLVNDADMIIYTDAGFASYFCSSPLGGTSSESCSGDPDDALTTMYIQIKSFSENGTSFDLTVN